MVILTRHLIIYISMVVAIWIRVYSSNSEDDAVHVGLDGEWPVAAARWRTTINDEWGWQRNRRFLTHAEEGGVPLLAYLDVQQTGQRDLRISMREDGAKLDKIVLALDESNVPTGLGPKPCPLAK